LQLAFVFVAVTVIALGWVRVTDLVAEHPAPSVTVTVYVPAVNPVFVDVTGSTGVFTFVARCSVNGTGGGVPVNTLESLTLTRF
jgi:hypothetical protein